MPLPTLAIAALGGTLSMKANHANAGVVPAMDALAMVQAIPQLAHLAQVHAETLQLVPSASLGFKQLLDALHWADAQVKAGVQGVIITQGTDTLEESAWFLDLLWPHDTPLILTGAMRPASHPQPDGPANLLTAATVALAPQSRGRGVLVVMNERVHTARHVRKTHSLALHAFTSPGHGPVGVMAQGHLVYIRAPEARTPLPVPEHTDHDVALLEATLGAQTRVLDQVVPLGYAGLVVNGFGAGHVPEPWAQRLGAIAEVLPVVVATRTGEGSTAYREYGYAGGEIDLQQRGVVMAGELCGRKCRVLMWVLTGCGRARQINEYL
ncbi:asparaginase [Pseudomonas abieticivorans]|uniref:asparaginase n=1 Tax=Pseudomonas abieticivorans TaxID=2931382 RepID=UPI0020C15B6E|nr:asparaginase [Pseudomonas sp. PIA16]